MANCLARWIGVKAGAHRPVSFMGLVLLAIVALGIYGCAAQQPVEVKPQPAVQPPKPAPAPAPVIAVTPSQKINDLSVREERGQTVLLIKFAQPLSNYRHFPMPNPARIVLDIFSETKQGGATDTFRLDTSIASTLRVSQLDGGLRITTDIAAAAVPAYSINQEGGGLRVVIGAENPNAAARKNVTLVSGGVRADVRGEDLAKAGGSSSADKSPSDKKEYNGQKISLEFKDADIKNVFRLLGEVSGKNIVITDDVNRKVTLRLIEVPWDQAMDLIIDTNGLAKEEADSIIRISTATRMAADRQQQLAARKASQVAEVPLLTYLTVNYAQAKEIVDKVKQLIKGGAEITPDERSNVIIVRGSRTDLAEAVEIVSKLDVRTPQVLIESNLIETNPTFSRSLAMEMDGLFSGGRVDMAGRYIAGTPFSGGLQGNAVPGVLSLPNTGFKWGYFGNNINAVLSAAEAEGNAKIISRPSVVTLNNVESTIESARIRRVVTSSATVGEAGSVREIRAGIILKVKPQVSADGFVLLNIGVKSSTFDFSRENQGIPDENLREAKASVLVRDGETVVIGGILKDTSSNNTAGVPYLKDIPVLGWIFSRFSVQKDSEELVVFITPRIIAAGATNLPTADQIWREQMKQTNGEVAPVTSLKP